MSPNIPPRHGQTGRPIDTAKLDRIVSEARAASDERAVGYREQALKLYPWVCGRCSREFDRLNLRELTVHHKNMDHDHNPPDGSNWELLCLYCHDNEHQRYEEHRAAVAAGRGGKTLGGGGPQTTHKALEGLAELLKGRRT